jgi:6-phosphogluconolactonase
VVPDSKDGLVSCFTLDRSTGALTCVQQVPSFGGFPCHTTLDTAYGASRLYVSNYLTGNIVVYPVDLSANGQMNVAHCVQHQHGHPTGVVPDRQENAHAHSVFLHPLLPYAVAVDLGCDALFLYRRAESFVPCGKVDLAVKGSGPRHLCFHPNGRFFYVICELNSTVTHCEWTTHENSHGIPEIVVHKSVSTLPADADRELLQNSTAEILMSPDGRFVYGSNRGHNRIAMYAVNQNTGELSVIGWEPTRGGRPRNFALVAQGAFLIVANQDSGNIVLFERNAETGTLAFVSEETGFGSPVCVHEVSSVE